MRYGTIAAVMAAVLTFASAAVAATSGYHFTNSGFPVCTDVGFSVSCSGEIAGLGGGDVAGSISANGTEVGVTCTSPGGNEAPGQNPAIATTASGSGDFGNPKNGRLSFSLATNAPAQPTAAQAGCPNKNWTAAYSDVTFTSYSFTITQGSTTLYSCSGSFDPSPSTNGETSTPTCTPST